MADDARAVPTSRRWLGCGAAGLMLLACALPWHRALGRRAVFAVAPDLRATVLNESTSCTVASHWSVLLIALVALGLQILLAARWPRQRVLIAVGTLVVGLAAILVTPVTALAGHGIFGRVQALSGMILYLVAAFLLCGAGLAQILARPKAPPAADPLPLVDPPSS